MIVNFVSMRYFIQFPLVLYAFCWALTVHADSAQSQYRESDFFPERVNLALRKTADRLLDISGDSTSTIGPVRQEQPGEFIIRIENKLVYDSLPKVLENAMILHQLENNYIVSLTDCETGQVVLGYAKEELKTTIPCQGRQLDNECFQLSLIFPSSAPDQEQTRYWYLALVGTFLIGLMLYQKLKLTSNGERPSRIDENDGLSFGNTLFDVTNQLLVVAGTEKNLTYREAKLLRFLLTHKNQLLEREQILSAVWEDEGIMVGRSLDVFVSRLRKLLKADSSVKISNVHGVGYRFEVVEE